MPTCISTINKRLAKAGVEERLVRNPAGYYYLSPCGRVDLSIYTYRLDVDETESVAAEINTAFAFAGLPAPLDDNDY